MNFQCNRAHGAPLRPWRFPTIIRPALPRWKTIKKAGPQLDKFRRDSLETTLSEEQTKVDQACEILNRAARQAGLGNMVTKGRGLLDQRKTVRERTLFVRMAYKLICDVQQRRLPPGQYRFWFAVTTIHKQGLVTAEGMSPALLRRLSKLQQARRRKLGLGGLEIGWKDLSKNTHQNGDIIWCWHIHSIVGVVAANRASAKAKVKVAYHIDDLHPDVSIPLDVRDTFLAADFTNPKQSIAGWLAYSSRSARISMNIERNKFLSGPLGWPKKYRLQTVQMAPLLMFFSSLKIGDRRVLGGCRVETDKLVLTDKVQPYLKSEPQNYLRAG